MPEYIILEGKIINSRGEAERVGSLSSPPQYEFFMNLDVDIDGRTYKVPINGSWPLERGNAIRLYFERTRPIFGLARYDVIEREITEEDLKRRETLKPNKVEKLDGDEVVFVYENSYPYA